MDQPSYNEHLRVLLSEDVNNVHALGDRDRDLLIEQRVRRVTAQQMAEMTERAMRSTQNDIKAVSDLTSLVAFRLCNVRPETLATAAAKRYGDRFLAAFRGEVLDLIQQDYDRVQRGEVA